MSSDCEQIMLSGRKMKLTMMTRKYWSMLFAGTIYMSITTLLVMSDSVIAGKIIGEDAVSGINLVTPLFCAATFSGSLFSIGVPILYSKEMGRFNKEKADQAFGLGLGMTALLGLAMMILSLLAGDRYLRFFQPAETVFLHGKQYLFWMSFVFLALPLNSYFSEMVIADGDETIPMIAGVVQIVGNIGASVLLCHLIGTAGISLGTLLSNIISLIIVLTHMTRKTNSIKPGIYFSWSMMKNVFQYGLIDSSSYLFLAVFAIAIVKFDAWRFGRQMLPIASAVLLLTEARLVFDGIGMTVGPIISIYLSEGTWSGVRKLYGIAKRTCVIEGILLCILLNCLAPFIPDILGVSEPELTVLIISCTRLVSLGYVFTSYLYLTSSYYLMRGKIGLSLMICCMRDVMIAIPLSLIMGILLGVNGMFIGLMISPLGAAIISDINVLRKYGKAEYPLLITKMEKKRKSLWFEFDVIQDEIIRVRNEAEDELKTYGYDNSIISKVILLIEEVFALIHDKNEGKSVQAECTLIMKEDSIELVEKDNGMIFNLADTDTPVDSFRAYISTSIIEGYSLHPRHLNTLSCNRNVFKICRQVDFL